MSEDREALADLGRRLGPLVRAGLWGANVPSGMDKPVAIHTTDASVMAAQDEFARRALVWALTHPDAEPILTEFLDGVRHDAWDEGAGAERDWERDKHSLDYAAPTEPPTNPYPAAPDREKSPRAV
jgi:hypothetical protein